MHGLNLQLCVLPLACYCYEGKCSVPGPTIVTTPDSTLSVVFTNNLGPNPEGESTTMNKMHSPSTVNLHTHGLHVDPSVDSIFVSIELGQSHTYNYEIPASNHPGNSWYHSHKHGSSALQVMSGLVGGLRVDPSSALDIPAALSAMARVTMVMHHLALENLDTAGDPFTVWTYHKLHTTIGSQDLVGVVYEDKRLTDAWCVNGQY